MNVALQYVLSDFWRYVGVTAWLVVVLTVIDNMVSTLANARKR